MQRTDVIYAGQLLALRSIIRVILHASYAYLFQRAKKEQTKINFLECLCKSEYGHYTTFGLKTLYSTGGKKELI